MKKKLRPLLDNLDNDDEGLEIVSNGNRSGRSGRSVQSLLQATPRKTPRDLMAPSPGKKGGIKLPA